MNTSANILEKIRIDYLACIWVSFANVLGLIVGLVINYLSTEVIITPIGQATIPPALIILALVFFWQSYARQSLAWAVIFPPMAVLFCLLPTISFLWGCVATTALW